MRSDEDRIPGSSTASSPTRATPASTTTPSTPWPRRSRVRLPAADRRRRGRRHRRRPHALQGGAEARPGEGAGPRRHGPDAGAGQGLPHRRQPDGRRSPTGTTTCCRSSWPSCKALNFDLGLLGFDQDELAELLDPGVAGRPVRSRRRARAAGRGDHAAGRPVDAGRPSAALRRQQQARGRGPAARRRADPPGQHRPAVQREGRAAVATTPSPPGSVVVRRAPSITRRSTWRGIPSKAKPTQQEAAGQGPAAGQRLRVATRSSTGCSHAWFGNMARVLRAGPRLLHLGRLRQLRATTRRCSRRAGSTSRQAIIWDKEHPVLTRKDFMGNHEWCFYGWREGAATRLLRPQQRARRVEHQARRASHQPPKTNPVPVHGVSVELRTA